MVVEETSLPSSRQLIRESIYYHRHGHHHHREHRTICRDIATTVVVIGEHHLDLLVRFDYSSAGGVSFSIIRGGTCSYLQSPSALRDMKRVGSRKQPQVCTHHPFLAQQLVQHTCRRRLLTTSYHALQYKYIGDQSSLHLASHRVIISSNQRIK